MSPVALLGVYCTMILLASLVGGWLPIVVRLSHRRMQAAVSLVAGIMLGVGLLHLLPHALMEAPDALDTVFIWTLVGFLVMFFLERFFCFHHHEVPHNHDPQDHQVGPAGEGHGGGGDGQEGHDQTAGADNCPHLRSDSHRLTWSGAAVGLTLHTVIAGIALAAAVEVELHGDHFSGAAGLGTFLVIVLHKPFDAMTISTLMTVGGWSLTARHIVNGLFALMIPVGVLLFHLGLGHTGDGSNLVPYALAFSAGTFLCISMSDLLPELQFHSHDRGILSAALLLGLSVAWGIGLIESKSHAGHDHQPGVQTHEHQHEGAHEH